MGKKSKRGVVRKDHLSIKASKEMPVAVVFILKPVVHIFLIAVIGFFVYANTFKVPFLFDDGSNIYKNTAIKDAGYFAKASVSEILTSPRLIGQLTFVMNHAVYGFDVAGYHIVNLVIHMGCGILLYWLVVLIFKTPQFTGYFQKSDSQAIRVQDFAALFVSLLFVSHPIQTQAVTYIVQRYASLATLFYLLALVLYTKYRLSGSSKIRYALYAISIISAMLGMKTKEIAFTLPVMITLCEFMFFRGAMKKRVCYLIPLILTMAIIPLSLVAAHGSSLNNAVSIDEMSKTAGAPDISRRDYLNTQFRVIVTYIRLLFLPVNQNLDYDYPIYRTFLTLPVFFSFLFLLAIFSGSVYLVYRSHKDKEDKGCWYRLIAFGIFWFIVTLSVESSIIPIKDVIFEHRLYLPSVGFFMAVMGGVMLLEGRLQGVEVGFSRKIIVAMMVLVILSLSFAAYARNMVWQSEIYLWEDVVKKSPGKTRGQYNLGLLYSKQGRLDEAINFYQTAIRISPNYYRPYNDLGNAYLNKGRVDDAFKEYQHALALKPDYAESHNNIGIVYVKKGRYDEAIGEFLLALKFKPKYADAHANIGNVFYEKRRFSEALRHYENALKIKPDHAMSQRQIEMIYRIEGKP